MQDLGFTAYELRLLSFKARYAEFPPVSDCLWRFVASVPRSPSLKAEQMRKSQFPAHQLLTGGYSSAELTLVAYLPLQVLENSGSICSGKKVAIQRRSTALQSFVVFVSLSQPFARHVSVSIGNCLEKPMLHSDRPSHEAIARHRRR